MPRGSAKPKPVETQYFSLETPEDFLELSKAALGWGYAGLISSRMNPDMGGGPLIETWHIQLDSELQVGFEANKGEVILWESGHFRAITANEFQEKYNA